MILIMQHSVRDFDAWQRFFEANEQLRVKYGGLGHTLYRDVDEPNNVTLLLRYESRERAEEFARSPELAAAMKAAGVITEPRVWWVERVEDLTYAGSKAA